jgi:hypothetical protein
MRIEIDNQSLRDLPLILGAQLWAYKKLTGLTHFDFAYGEFIKEFPKGIHDVDLVGCVSVLPGSSIIRFSPMLDTPAARVVVNPDSHAESSAN